MGSSSRVLRIVALASENDRALDTVSSPSGSSEQRENSVGRGQRELRCVPYLTIPVRAGYDYGCRLSAPYGSGAIVIGVALPSESEPLEPAENERIDRGEIDAVRDDATDSPVEKTVVVDLHALSPLFCQSNVVSEFIKCHSHTSRESYNFFRG